MILETWGYTSWDISKTILATKLNKALTELRLTKIVATATGKTYFSRVRSTRNLTASLNEYWNCCTTNKTCWNKLAIESKNLGIGLYPMKMTK